MSEMTKILNSFKSISLDEMDAVRLMNRTDTKYVFPHALLPDLLKDMNTSYRSLKIEGTSISRYKTRYFDTPDLRFYLDHHNGKRPRFKVRYREYIESGITFFEVKKKNNKDRTIKKRFRVPSTPDHLGEKEEFFVRDLLPEPPGVLQPAIWSAFSRITLVNNNFRERITIDTGLGFHDEHGQVEFPFLVVAEIKRDASTGFSVCQQQLKSRGIDTIGLSKYCTGIFSLKENVKLNRFKEKIIFINKLAYADKSYPIAG